MSALTTVIALAYAALSGRALLLWWRRADAASARLAVALSALAVLTVSGAVADAATHIEPVLETLETTLLLLFPWLLARFAVEHRPVSRTVAVGGTAATAAMIITGWLLSLPQHPDTAATGITTTWALGATAVWVATGVVALRLLQLAAGAAAPVAAERMRLLTLGSALVLVAILITSRGGLTGVGHGVGVLGGVVLLVAFGTPGRGGLTRRLAPVDATLLEADDQGTVVDELVTRAAGLVGSATVVALDARWRILGHHGPDDDADALTAEAVRAAAHSDGMRLNRRLAAVPLGDGLLVVRTGPATPLFGPAEVARLRSLAIVGSLALERVDLAARERDAGRALQEREAQLREAQELAMLLAWRWDVASGDIEWSSTAHRIFGMSPGRHDSLELALRMVHEDDRADVAECFGQCVVTGEVFEIEHRCLFPGGDIRWILSRGRPVSVDGRVVAVHGVSQDVTDQRAVAEELRQRARQQAAVAQLAQRALAMRELTEVIAEASVVVRQILGVPRVVVEAADPASGTAAEGTDTTTISVPVQTCGERAGTLKVDLGDQEVHDHDVEFLGAIAALIGAVAERVRSESMLAHQASHDPLTGLPNRAMLLDRLQRALDAAATRGDRVAVLFLDLDRFKIVNDSLGHGAGDALLCAVADRLRRSVRRSDLVARFGGDEFVIVAEGVDCGARTMAGTLREALSAPIITPEHELQTSASLGIVIADGTVDAEAVLRDADAAMYEAKAAGRDRAVVFGDAVRDRVAARLSLEQELRSALDGDRITVAYQPIVAVGSGRVHGAEALARMTLDDGTIVSPAAFIPIAEESRLIDALGTSILEQACAAAAGWSAEDGGAGLSVNVSARQLRTPGFARRVSRIAEAAGLPVDRLCLEITESTLVDDEELIRVMRSLRDAGMRLSIDDFGTGYSALAYLQRLPATELKIDRVFVDRLGGSDAEPLVGAILGISAALGMVAVAEGVERPQQLLALHRLGCPLAQGYLFSPPTTPEEIALMVAANGEPLVTSPAVALPA